MQLQFGPSGIITIEDVIIMQLRPNFICGFDAQTVLTCGGKKTKHKWEKTEKAWDELFSGQSWLSFCMWQSEFCAQGHWDKVESVSTVTSQHKADLLKPRFPALSLQSFSVDDTALFQCSSFCPRSQISTFIVHIFLSVFNKCCSLISDLISILNRTLLLLQFLREGQSDFFFFHKSSHNLNQH